MIYLSPYDPQWPALFEKEKELLLKSVGEYIVGIEHIGSTAIPKICAKPVIDIMMGVKQLDSVDREIIKRVESIGHEYIKKYEETMPFRRFFQKDNSEGLRTHRIHLVEITNAFWQRHLLFRDYLRTHSDDAKRYERLKIDLAKKFTDTNQYANAKTDFCNQIYIKARAW
ncbi:MAG: GrpB family protein [Gammaproteobacteria bacterium]